MGFEPMTGGQKVAALIGFIVLLSFASFKVTFGAADEEPFFEFQTFDAMDYVGFSAVLMVFWIQFDLGVVIAILKRKLSPAWIVAVIWSFVCMFGIGTAIDTWTWDMANHGFETRK